MLKLFHWKHRGDCQNESWDQTGQSRSRQKACCRYLNRETDLVASKKSNCQQYIHLKVLGTSWKTENLPIEMHTLQQALQLGSHRRSEMPKQRKRWTQPWSWSLLELQRVLAILAESLQANMAWDLLEGLVVSLYIEMRFMLKLLLNIVNAHLWKSASSEQNLKMGIQCEETVSQKEVPLGFRMFSTGPRARKGVDGHDTCIPADHYRQNRK